MLDLLQYTKSPLKRLEGMRDALGLIDDIDGDIAECGIWRGGNIILARRLQPKRVCWLYDTFTGMSNATVFDHTRGFRRMDKPGKDAVSVAQVIDNLKAKQVYDESKLRFIKGPVEETLLDARNLPDRLALLRLDTDWYESTKIELQVLYPRLVSGGVLIIDDYGHWMGCRKAVDEYFGPSFRATIIIDYSCVMVVKC